VAGRLARREALAREAEQRHAWAVSAGEWSSIAQALGDAGEPARAARAWDAAGEAWRRDDRPSLAIKALTVAVTLALDPRTHTTSCVKAAACAAALGRLKEAESRLRVARESAPPSLVALVADGQIDVALARADVKRARALREDLAGDGAVRVVRSLRDAQLARLTGRHDEAAAHLERASEILPDARGRGALLGERAEQAVAQEDWNTALAMWPSSATWHAEAGRWGPAASAIAAQLRTAALAGVQVTGVPELHPGDPGRGAVVSPAQALRGLLGHAKARQLRLLVIDVTAAAALYHRDAVQLKTAIAVSDAVGARLRSGRLRLCGFALALVPERERARASRDLADLAL